MRTVLRAVAEPHAQRADSWRETVSTAFAGLEIDLDRAPDEHDQIVIGQAGPAQFIESRSGPGRARRTSAHIRSNNPDRYVLFAQAEGSSVGEQLGRRTRYRRGDLGLLDLSLPLRCKYTARRAVMVSYPKALCPFGEAEVAPLFGTALGGATGAPALISGLVRELPRHLASEDEAASARVARRSSTCCTSGWPPGWAGRTRWTPMRTVGRSTPAAWPSSRRTWPTRTSRPV